MQLGPLAEQWQLPEQPVMRLPLHRQPDSRTCRSRQGTCSHALPSWRPRPRHLGARSRPVSSSAPDHPSHALRRPPRTVTASSRQGRRPRRRRRPRTSHGGTDKRASRPSAGTPRGRLEGGKLAEQILTSPTKSPTVWRPHDPCGHACASAARSGDPPFRGRWPPTHPGGHRWAEGPEIKVGRSACTPSGRVQAEPPARGRRPRRRARLAGAPTVGRCCVVSAVAPLCSPRSVARRRARFAAARRPRRAAGGRAPRSSHARRPSRPARPARPCSARHTFECRRPNAQASCRAACGVPRAADGRRGRVSGQRTRPPRCASPPAALSHQPVAPRHRLPIGCRAQVQARPARADRYGRAGRTPGTAPARGGGLRSRFPIRALRVGSWGRGVPRFGGARVR